ncbi:hypothetical protein [Brevibacterium litoralis]|uniref:hypothetical protein n=1 Tax=Brevibacterium litoralis TaxID=3138935 RepID=UPI0032EBBC22
MALAEIGLEEMDTLVTAMTDAKEDIRADVLWLSRRAQEHHLTSEFSESADRTCEWIDEVLPDLRRRLALAREIDRATPTELSVVVIDESDLPTATPHEAEQDARTVAEAASGWNADSTDPLPPEILRLLRENSGDPYFDDQLAKSLPPAEYGAFIEALGKRQSELSPRPVTDRNGETTYPSEDEVRQAEDFGLTYYEIASLMGTSYANSSHRWTPEQQTEWKAQFPTTGTAQHASALGWAMTFGTWDPDVVQGTVEQMYFKEQRSGSGSNTWMNSGFTLPDGTRFRDAMSGALIQVARQPELAQRMLDPDAPVREVEGTTSASRRYPQGEPYTVTTAKFLEYLLVRDWRDEGVALTSVLESAMSPHSPDYEAAQRIAERMDTIIEEAEKAAAEAEEKNSGPMAWVHGILDVLGLVPVLGELFDGLNGIIYTAEGDFVNAGLSFAGMVPVAGWGSVAAKVSRQAEKLNDLRRIADTADTAADARRAVDAPTPSTPDLTISYGHLDNAATVGRGTDLKGTLHIDRPSTGTFKGWSERRIVRWAESNNISAVDVDKSSVKLGTDEHYAASVLAEQQRLGNKFDLDAFNAKYDKKVIDNRKGNAYEEAVLLSNQERFPTRDPESNWKETTPGAGDDGVPYRADGRNDASSDRRYFDAVNETERKAVEVKSGKPIDNSRPKNGGETQWEKDVALANGDPPWEITYILSKEPSESVKKRMRDNNIRYEVTDTEFG